MSKPPVGIPGAQRWRKLKALFGVLLHDPAEFYVRSGVLLEAAFSHALQGRIHQPGRNLQEAIEWLSSSLGRDASEVLREEPLARIDAESAETLELLARSWAIPLSFCADQTLARLCYVACRLLRPNLVVETGVAYGVTSAYLLAALDANQKGCLISVDLPPLGAAENGQIGAAVPKRLRTRWRLELGSSRKLLPGLVTGLNQVDLFVHDSLHTYRHMRWELSFIEPRLKPGAVVLCDDAHNNTAFLEWLCHPRVRDGIFVRRGKDSEGLIGMSVLRAGNGTP